MNDLRIPIANKDVAYEWYANQFCLELHERGKAKSLHDKQLVSEEDFKDGYEVFSFNMREDAYNWERVRMSASGGVMTVKMEAAGTGTIRKAVVYPKVYEGLKINITDTAKGESLLLDLQIRGVTRFSRDHNGVDRWYDAEGKLLSNENNA